MTIDWDEVAYHAGWPGDIQTMLETIYRVEGSLRAAGCVLAISCPSVSNKLIEYGVKLNFRGGPNFKGNKESANQKILSDKDLIKNMTAKDIADHYKIGLGSVYDILCREKLPYKQIKIRVGKK